MNKDQPHQLGARMLQYLVIQNRQTYLNQYDPSGREVILMIRGLSRSYQAWMGLQYDLSEAFDIICMDLPGFGLSKKQSPLYSVKSMAAQLVKVLEKLPVERYYLLAPSLGGMVILELAYQLPRDRVGGLMLMSPSHSGLGVQRLTQDAFKRFLKSPQSNPKERVELMKPVLVGRKANGQDPFEADPNLEQEWDKFFLKDQEELGVKGQMAQIIAAVGYTTRRALNHVRKFQIPTMILMPTQDQFIPMEHAYKVAEYLRHPQSSMVEFQLAGHDIVVTHKKQLKDAITQFVKDQDKFRVFPVELTPQQIQIKRRTQVSLSLVTFGLFLLSLVLLDRRKPGKP